MRSNYDFDVIASGLDPDADDFETRFWEAGCDDATVSFQRGRIIIAFAREAASAEAALDSALSAVRAAGATVLRIEPDPLVCASDIAERTGLTRAAASLYAKGARGTGFPAPVVRVTTDSPLYDWAEVARWLQGRGQVPARTVEVAEAIARANAALQAEAETGRARGREAAAAGSRS
ncbi:MAG: helix-turn-helix transcriptional regulator [Salinarimonas sp.]